MKALIGGIATGFAAYFLLKWIRSLAPAGYEKTPSGMYMQKGGMGRLGDEAGAYSTLFSLRNQLQNATQNFSDAMKRVEELDMELIKQNDEYLSAEPDRKPTVMLRIAEIQSQRDQGVLESELIIRNVINPLRERLITEEARLKSLVIAPEIAINRTGTIPAR